VGGANRTLRDAFVQWKNALIDQAKQTTQAALTAVTRVSLAWKI